MTAVTPIAPMTPMTPSPNRSRRALLAAAAVGLPWMVGCRGTASPVTEEIPAVWVGVDVERGHRLRNFPALSTALPVPALRRQAGVLIVGGGVAGLAALRAFYRQGVDDVQLLELEDSVGGNSRGHRLAGLACPLGAHYLPLPGPQAREVSDWLHEIGLLKFELGRTVAEERHLCHSPQERLFIDGAWAEGLLPPADASSVTARQYQNFARRVAEASAPLRGRPAFAMPAHRAAWSAELQSLNERSFADWLDGHGLNDARLRWYLDYCCRDDYGAAADTVSAWAGLHYFASRHGFNPPGLEAVEREPVFTWSEGNQWLVNRLAEPPAERLHTARTVLRVTEGRHGVEVLAWDEKLQRAEAWRAQTVVLALPLFVAARLLAVVPAALQQAAVLLQRAPWLVANLQLQGAPLDRPGAPPSWDNVIYGSNALGYVDAMHQSLRSAPGPTVFTAYHPLVPGQRAGLLADPPARWADLVLQALAVAHPDIQRRVQRIEMARWAHAMAIPRPGVHRHPALSALRAARGRVRFAHADLAGYSVFEEAFVAGSEVAGPAPKLR